MSGAWGYDIETGGRLAYVTGVQTCALPICYVFSWQRVIHALHVLSALKGGIPIRHWLSLKSQPLRRLVQEWRSLDAGIEVVSEFELRAALNEGFSPEHILVNGVGKHKWMADLAVPGLRVNFDSLEEIGQLAGV